MAKTSLHWLKCPFGQGPVRFPHKIKDSIQRFLHFAAVTPIQETKYKNILLSLYNHKKEIPFISSVPQYNKLMAILVPFGPVLILL